MASDAQADNCIGQIAHRGGCLSSRDFAAAFGLLLPAIRSVAFRTARLHRQYGLAHASITAPGTDVRWSSALKQ
jgi:hypothetical protein